MAGKKKVRRTQARRKPVRPAQKKPVRKKPVRSRSAQKWTRLSRRNHVKMLAVFFMIVMALAAMMVRLVWIERADGEKYQKIVLANASYDSTVIPYRRGDIMDSKGIVLATSLEVYNIILDNSVLLSKESYLEPTIHALMTCFPELSEEDIRAHVRENPDSRYKILAKHIPYEEVESFQKMQEEPKDAKESTAKYIRGVWFEKEFLRSYPYQSLASSVIGFTTAGNEGMAGLENYYNSTLNGTNGRQYGNLNSDNDIEKTIKPAIDGNNIVTTIDMNIQSIVEAKIKEFNKAYRNHAREGDGAKSIGVIIQDPNTGAIKAMADYPDYDLSDPRNLENYRNPDTYRNYTKEEIEKMSEEEKAETLNGMWSNFCVSETYEPGSTQKPMTVAAGLDSGKLSGNETYYCDGHEQIADREINCANKYGHKMETIQGALMDSCNDALMQMVRKIGKEVFYSYQSNFGMGFKTNIDLPGEARTDTLVRTAEHSSVVDLATASFGQNFNCTMIQLISAFSSIVNGGNYYQPYVVERITDENGNTVEEKKPKLLKQTISKETSDQLKQYMLATVAEGSAKTAKVPGYSMGGKTGTAEKMPRDDKNYLVSFIGYLPQENPQLVIYAVIDTPNQPARGEAQAHSTFAQNLAREILEDILPYMNIYKDEKVKKGAMTKKKTNMYTDVKGYEAAAALGDAVTYN
ncbi:MAG: peptidoglycan glycosyltransferase [Eubacterium sp.]|nr:peptidoglycan glycosyltransferase [Eubacterium sp.]